MAESLRLLYVLLADWQGMQAMNLGKLAMILGYTGRSLGFNA